MGNLLTRLDFYIKGKEAQRIACTMGLVLDCFRSMRSEIYDHNEEDETSISMFQRFKWVDENIPKLEKAYGIKITLDKNRCSPQDRIFVPDRIPSLIFSNAVQNASKAGATEVRVTYVSTSNYVSITFTDNGRGMSEEELDNLGFYSDGQGVKLIRGSMCAYGGVCWWESQKGEGTKLITKFRKNRYLIVD